MRMSGDSCHAFNMETLVALNTHTKKSMSSTFFNTNTLKAVFSLATQSASTRSAWLFTIYEQFPSGKKREARSSFSIFSN